MLGGIAVGLAYGLIKRQQDLKYPQKPEPYKPTIGAIKEQIRRMGKIAKWTRAEKKEIFEATCQYYFPDPNIEMDFEKVKIKYNV